MSSQIGLIHDRLIAEDKLKDGTKYERLAAIEFCFLTGRDNVHDLRLRGAAGVRHQIDAVVGEERKRILVETKDYGRVIGLPIIRKLLGCRRGHGSASTRKITFIRASRGVRSDSPTKARAKVSALITGLPFHTTPHQ